MVRAEPLVKIRLVLLASEVPDAALELARFGVYSPGQYALEALTDSTAAAYRDAWQEAESRLSKLIERCEVFLNLITNAIDAHDGKPYGSVRITTQSDPDRRLAAVKVADTGSRIKPDHLNVFSTPSSPPRPWARARAWGCRSASASSSGWEAA